MDNSHNGFGGPPETGPLEGRYANYFTVGHNAVEFLLDFGQFNPESEQAQAHTRIITNPIYAKVLLETLLESVELRMAIGSTSDIIRIGGEPLGG